MPRWLAAVLLLVFAGATPAQAHLASDSYLRIEIDVSGGVAGQWDVALRDLDVTVGLDADQDGTITWRELRAKKAEIENYVFGRLTLLRGQQPCRLVPNALLVDYHAGSAYAVIPFSADCPGEGALMLRYRLLFDLDPSHRGLLTVVEGGNTRSEVLTPEHADIPLAGEVQGVVERARQFFRFGFDHILLGYDHLLFITVLLVTAALQRTGGGAWEPITSLGRVLRETLKTLTAFTLAHGAVLLPAVIGLISVSSRLVQPAVAVTIILAAIDNIRPILPRLRWQVAFLFGVIHGLSVAGTLGPMRLGPADLGTAFVSFNLGVEAGQIALALLILPIAFILRNEAGYRRLAAPAVSLGAAVFAAIWLIGDFVPLDFASLEQFVLAAPLK